MTALYYYTARSAEGRFVRGSLEAGNRAAALASLRTRSLFVTSLETANSSGGAFAALAQIGSVSRGALVTLFRSFATLVRAGVPIRRSLDVAMEQCHDARLREALASVVNDIENGLALSEAMSRRPREFSRLFVAMIRAGELGGVLDDVLERLASVLERDSAVRKRVAAALAYPAIVAFAAVALILFLLVSIVPMFQSMYAQMHVQLPPITVALISAGSALRSTQTWALAVPVIMAGVLVAAALRTNDDMRGAMEGMVLRIPVAGNIRRKSTIARFARMLGTLLRSGVGLVPAIEVVSDLVESVSYRRSLDALRQSIDEGSSLSNPLAASGLYEPLFIQLLRVGEETGALDSMLLRIAEYYEVDVEAALAALGGILEPAMILMLGGAVGFIVSAIFIPLYTLIGNIK
jgi:type IV pilus assembly protein PilC